jgi:hypothetical protein
MNARVAGFTFLIYIAVALSAMILLGRAAIGEGTAERLAGIARHAADVRLGIVLELAGCFCALVLAVTLYAITQDQDPDLARLAMICCAAEGVIGALSLPRGLGRLWLATAAGTDAPDPAAAATIGTLLMKLPDSSPTIGVTFFAVGSAVFAWLLLRGRMVPVALSGLGVLASILPAILLPVRLVGIPLGPARELMWLPMLVFEVSIALWLIVKGAAMPARRTTATEA